MTYQTMVSEVGCWIYRFHLVVNNSANDKLDFISSGTDTGLHQGFHCVILDLKDLPSLLFEE